MSFKSVVPIRTIWAFTWSISPYDEYAIELALEHKDSDPATTVSVVTVGPARSRDALRQALAMGCDDATLVTAPEDLAGLDVAKALAAVVKEMKPDVVLFGELQLCCRIDFVGRAQGDAWDSV